MKKRISAKIVTATITSAMILALAGNAAAFSYFGYDDFGGTYQDAEKSPSNGEDDLMCWAAATANILAWTGWGDVYSSDTDQVFQYYQDHWTDEGGHMYFGFDWWFSGVNQSQGWSGWSQVDQAGGGFYTDLNYSDYYFYSAEGSQAMDIVDQYLHDGYGVSLGIHGPGGHAVTVWGYEYDDMGNYLGLYLTDSDNSKYWENPSDILSYYDVTYQSGYWYLQDYNGLDSWYIGDVTGLAQFDLGSPDARQPGEPVPEPSTIFLFGAGLAGLGRYRRKA